jgi:hypothetical protein
MLSIGGIYFYFKFLVDGFKVAEMFKDFFSIQNFENFIFGLFITFTLLFVSFLSIFSQKQCAKVHSFFDICKLFDD